MQSSRWNFIYLRQIVQSTHYVAENLAFIANGSSDDFATAELETVSALGEEFGEVFDLDIGIS